MVETVLQNFLLARLHKTVSHARQFAEIVLSSDQTAVNWSCFGVFSTDVQRGLNLCENSCLGSKWIV